MEKQLKDTFQDWILKLKNLNPDAAYQKLEETDKAILVKVSSQEFWLPKSAMLGESPAEFRYDSTPIPEPPEHIRERYDKYTQQFGFTLMGHQIYAIEKTKLLPRRIWNLAQSLGKQNYVNEIIPTPSGFRRFGDIKKGDLVFGDDGKPVKVTGVFPQKENEDYRISFKDGNSVIAGADHLWEIWQKGRKNPKIKKTKDLLDCAKPRGTMPYPAYKYFIRTPDPIDYQRKDFLIQPYSLGVLIGNGALKTKTEFCHSQEDYDISERVKVELPDHMTTSERLCGGVPHFDIVKLSGKNRKDTRRNPFTEEIRRLRLNCKSTEKFIPNEYKISSIDQRLDLLRGLMDTDGSCNQQKSISLNRNVNCASFFTSSKLLAHDVSELVFSLGGVARIHEYDRVDRYNKEYAVSIFTKQNPFYAQRKHKNWSYFNSCEKRTIVSVEKIEPQESMCISVSNENGLYLIGKSYILTHNTYCSLPLILANKKNLIIAKNSILDGMWIPEILNTFCKHKEIVDLRDTKVGDIFPKLKDGQIGICNYEFLWRRDGLDLTGVDVFCDEAVAYGNPQSKQSKHFFKHEPQAKTISYMSGSLLDGKCEKARKILNTCGWNITEKEFEDKFCHVKLFRKNGYVVSKNIFGYKNKKELVETAEKYGCVTIRKEQCVNLPEKIFQTMHCHKSEAYKYLTETRPDPDCPKKIIDGKEVPNLIKKLRKKDCEKLSEKYGYDFIKEDMHIEKEITEKEAQRRGLSEKERIEKNKIINFNNILAMRKCSSMLSQEKGELLKDLLEEMPNEKIVMFYNFDAECDFIKKVVKDTGRVPREYSGRNKKTRQTELENWKKSDSDIIIGQINSMSKGLNLQCSSKTIYFSAPNDVENFLQSSDRIHRPGQKDSCIYYLLSMDGTHEERMWEKMMDYYDKSQVKK